MKALNVEVERTGDIGETADPLEILNDPADISRVPGSGNPRGLAGRRGWIRALARVSGSLPERMMDRPQMAAVKIAAEHGLAMRDVASRVEEINMRELSGIEAFCKELSEGKSPVC
jgi:hypothetical protein